MKIIIAFILLLASGEIMYSGSNMSSNLFEGRTQVGRSTFPGSVAYDSVHATYRVTGSGENMWGAADAFYYVWRKVGGDLVLRTHVAWEGKGKNPHRKAGWVVRSGLDPDAAYVDAVVHGDGLISMQFRKERGATTLEIQAPYRGPATVSLERHGDQFTLSLVDKDGTIHPACTATIKLRGDLYAGLAVCSHDTTVAETAIFSEVEYGETGSVPDDKRVVESTLETLELKTGYRQIVRRAREHFEAPNWSRDGRTLLYNSGGRLYTIPLAGGTPVRLNTSFADRCNNDHGLSPDGKQIVISHHGKDGKSMIYLLPSEGGEPRLVTPLGPSYWHGWSPDGGTLAYCAERNGEFDVYTIPIEGGQERRLTTAKGLDDGPDYSPDGKFIYFNSVRTGRMKIWRMTAEGKEQTQISPDDEYGDWFAHPSPDGKWIIFISYDKSVEGHPANKDVVLRTMTVAGVAPVIVATLFGGQGTMNVPSWSPDSRMVAFVSYRLVAP